MQLADVRRVLKAKVVSSSYHPDLPVVAGSAADLMSDVLAFSREGAVLLTGLITLQVIRTAEMAGVAAVVIVRGKAPPRETVQLAEDIGMPLLATHFTLFESCGRLYAAGLRGCDVLVAPEEDAVGELSEASG